MSHITLITGGARSGKSRFAELLAKQHSSVIYVATAQVYDSEMELRVEKHRAQRPAHWQLVEEPYHLAQVLRQYEHQADVMLIDCITLWLTNLILANSQDLDWSAGDAMKKSDQELLERKVMAQVQEAVQAAAGMDGRLIFVSNEVGMGIVPDNPLSRLYRDLAGRANQMISQAADEVYLVVAGYPVEIKQQGAKMLAALTGKQSNE